MKLNEMMDMLMVDSNIMKTPYVIGDYKFIPYNPMSPYYPPYCPQQPKSNEDWWKEYEKLMKPKDSLMKENNEILVEDMDDNIKSYKFKLPGFVAEEIDISIEYDVLTVVAVKEEKSASTNNSFYSSKEFVKSLPKNSKVEAAHLENGILTIFVKMLKKENTKQKIKITQK